MLRSGIFMVCSAVVVALLNYALNVVLSWTLPIQDYGRIAVSQTLIFVVVWFLGAGLPWVVTRAIANGRASEDSAAAWRTYRTAWLANTALTLAVVGLLLLSFATGWLHLDPGYAPLIVLVAITTGALGVSAVPNAALQGLLRFGSIALVRVVEVVVNVVISIGLVVLGWGATGAMAGFALSAMLACGLTVLLMRDQPFWRVQGWGGLSTVRSAIPLTAAVFGGVLLTNLDVLAVKFLSSSASSDALSGTYQVAAALARAPLLLGTVLVGLFYPHMSLEQHRDQTGSATRELLRWVALVVLPLNTLMAVGAPAVVPFFYPGTYASAIPSLAVLSLGGACLAWASALAAIQQAAERTRVPALIMCAAVAMQLLGLVSLVPTQGLVGAAVASVLASLLACMLLLWSGRGRFRSAPPRLKRQGLAIGGLALVGVPLGTLLPHAERWVVAGYVALALGGYVAACFYLGLLDRQPHAFGTR